jgi:ribosomal protein L11 methyltransferase
LFHPHEKKRDELITELWEAGTLGIIEEEGAAIRAFFDDSHPFAPRDVIEERVEQENAVYAEQQQDWDGIRAGKRFFLAPPWVTDPAPDGRIRITLDSGTAFGTGRHETTQMMIERLEDIVKGGETVVDVGCGSGVLGEVSRLLGAGSIVGCDIDPMAVQAAAANFDLPVFRGSADAIASEYADILLVNISAKVIDALTAELKRITKPTGTVVLAGFVSANAPSSFSPKLSLERNDWLCWTGSREDLISHATPSGVLTHPTQWW